MIASRSCSHHENCCVDRAHSSGIGLLCIRADRLPAVRSEGADADRAGGPVSHGIGSVALRPGGRRAAKRRRRSAVGAPLRSAGAHDTWPDHREHFLVSPAPVPRGCGYSGRGCDFVGDRRVLSPPVLRRAICSEISVAHSSCDRVHDPVTSSFPLPDTSTYRYTPLTKSLHQRAGTKRKTCLKKNSVYSLATIWRRPR